MKSIIQKSLYTLFLASYIFSASCFADEKATPKESNETTSSSLKKEKEKSEQKSEQKIDESKKESEQKIGEKYFLFFLLLLAIVTVYMLSKKEAINYNDEHVKEIMNFLNKGGNINELKEGNSLLYTHAKNGNIDAVRYLIKEGANINLKNGKNEETALHAALENNQIKIAQILLQKGSAIEEDTSQTTPLYSVCGEKSNKNQIKDTVKVIESLIEKNPNIIDTQVANSGNTPLYRACTNLQLEIVKILLKKGATTKQNSLGNTPLHSLSFKKLKTNEEIDDAIKIIGLLIEHGIDINAQNKSGLTALHRACRRRNKEIVKILLANNATIQTDNHKNTPLHSLCRVTLKKNEQIDKAMKIIDLLVEHGIDINAENDKHKTAMDLASDRSNPQLVTKLEEIKKSN